MTTAIGFTAGDSGVFNVGTRPEHRGRGYGAAITSRVVSDGFAAGSELAFLQSSDPDTASTGGSGSATSRSTCS